MHRFISEIENSLFSNSFTITKNIFLFGSVDNNMRNFNHVFIYPKYFIFSTKCLPSFRAMLQQVKYVEENMTEKAKKQINFYHKWSFL